jgi:uncharacterized membrane protein (UPF0127 family)
MKRWLLLLALLLLPSNAEAAATASRSHTSALPPHSKVLVSRKVSGYQHARAVIYRQVGLFAGVEQNGRLLWHHRIAPGSPRIVSPGPRGLFAVVVKLTDGATLYAFHLEHGQVTSGFRDASVPRVTAAEGFRWSGPQFSALNPDLGHVGSVRYRTVDRYALCAALYCPPHRTVEPDYPPSQYPSPNGVVHTADGSTYLIKLEVAADETSREQGLMDRSSLDPDSGMVFVWDGLVLESFWMKDTYIPLTVAFLGPDGTIQQMFDMAPLNDSILYTPDRPYQYAIEVNKGYFQARGVKVGDKVQLTLDS